MRELAQIFDGTDKMLRHLDRLAAWQAGTLPPPVTVEFNVTNLCNHACAGCSFSYLVNVSKDSLPLDLAHRVIDELASFGVKALTFSGGGEPLTYGPDRVLSLMERARTGGLDVALITNGSLLRSPRFLELCEWVRVSLDGYDAETFARFHGRGAKEFGKIVGNLRALSGPRRGTLGVGFLTDAGSVERGDFPKMAQFCAGLGVDYLQFRPLVLNMVAEPSLRGGLAVPLDLGPLRTAYREALAFARSDFRVLWSEGKYEMLSRPDQGKTYSRCHAHFLEAVVAADAKVYICCHGQGQEAFCLGDLREQSFAEIWHGERARKVYESISPRDTCPPACRLSAHNALLERLTAPVPHGNFI